MTGLSRRLGRLEGWRRYIAAFVLGGLLTLALPPVYGWPALVIGFTGLVWLLDGCPGRRIAFLVGWCFGFGYLVLGLYWISFALLIEPDRFGWMVPFAVLGLPAGLALWTGLAALVLRQINPSGIARVVVLAALWSAAEWGRGHAFTGFPWNLIGYAAVGSEPLFQSAALFGVYGVGFFVVLAAAIPATWVDGAGDVPLVRRWGPSAAAALVIAVAWTGGALRLGTADDGMVAGVSLRLVQPNIAQHHKWRDERRRANVARHFQLTSQSGSDSITQVIWAETAVPYFLANDPDLARAIGNLVRPGGLVMTGAPRTTVEREPSFRAWNAIHAIDHSGDVVGTYDKSHLLPFGEYVPFRSFLRRLGVEKVASGQGDFQAGPGMRTLSLPGLPPVGPLICYEAIFPGQVVDGEARPEWLLNVTNDAWFGNTAGPYQHFAMAQARAVEEGLPMVRVANTGISGVVDAYGRVIARSDLGEARVMDVSLPVSLGSMTPYTRWGDLSLLPILVVVMIYTFVNKRPRITKSEQDI